MILRVAVANEENPANLKENLKNTKLNANLNPKEKENAKPKDTIRKEQEKTKDGKADIISKARKRARKGVQWTVLPKSGKCPKGYRKNIKQPGSKKKHFCISK